MRRLLALALLGTCSCSFLFVRGPEPMPPGQMPTCTEDVVLPIVDTVIFAADVVAAGINSQSTAPEAKSLLAGNIVGAALFGISSIYGYQKTATCRAARASVTVPVNAPAIGCQKDTDCKGDRICKAGVCSAP